jgi:hypothetical protein
VLACSAKDSFAERICSSRAARSSGIILRSTSACICEARASVQSCWMRASLWTVIHVKLFEHETVWRYS